MERKGGKGAVQGLTAPCSDAPMLGELVMQVIPDIELLNSDSPARGGADSSAASSAAAIVQKAYLEMLSSITTCSFFRKTTGQTSRLPLGCTHN